MAYVKSLFESYPSVNEFHFTNDGNAFEHKHNAESHAPILDAKNPEVLTITRMDLRKWELEGGVDSLQTELKQDASTASTDVERVAPAETGLIDPKEEDTAAVSNPETGASIDDSVTPASDAKAKQTTSKKEGKK